MPPKGPIARKIARHLRAARRLRRASLRRHLLAAVIGRRALAAKAKGRHAIAARRLRRALMMKAAAARAASRRRGHLLAIVRLRQQRAKQRAG
jgi:hypothetical protein